MKPNCYDCKFRRALAGDAHSRCAHPENDAISKNPLAEVLAILGSVGRGPGLRINALGVTGDPHGVRNGWFNWPLNYDPVWLLTCAGFSSKE